MFNRRKWRIKKALKSLGSTPDQVAETLRTNGIKGTHEGSTCPVAKYIRRTADVPHVSVSGHLVISGDAILNTPKPIMDFLKDYDSCRKYNDLYGVS